MILDYIALGLEIIGSLLELVSPVPQGTSVKEEKGTIEALIQLWQSPAAMAHIHLDCRLRPAFHALLWSILILLAQLRASLVGVEISLSLELTFAQKIAPIRQSVTGKRVSVVRQGNSGMHHQMSAIIVLI